MLVATMAREILDGVVSKLELRVVRYEGPICQVLRGNATEARTLSQLYDLRYPLSIKPQINSVDE